MPPEMSLRRRRVAAVLSKSSHRLTKEMKIVRYVEIEVQI